MGKIEDVANVLKVECANAVTNAGITVAAQAYIGAPFGPSLTKILTQGQWALTIMPLQGGRRLPPRGKDRTIKALSAPTLSVTVTNGPTGTVITFLGTVTAGYNCYVLIGHPVLGQQAVYYQTQDGDTPAIVASALQTQIANLGAPVTASTSSSSITVFSSLNVTCNIGSTGTILSFQSRFEQRIQVSAWVPTAYKNTANRTTNINKGLRASVTDAIISNIGTDMNMWYALPDGTALRLRLSGPPHYIDESQVDYNLYESHMIFLAEYTLDSTSTATQVGVVEDTTTVGDFSPVITIGG